MANKRGKSTRSAPKPKRQAGGAGTLGPQKGRSKKQTLTANLTGGLPTVDANIVDIAAQRATINNLSAQKFTNTTKVVQLRAQRRQLERTGATADQLARVDAQITKLRVQQASIAGQLQNANDRLATLRDRLAVELQPEQLVSTLDGKVPILLLPVRLETRFFNSNTELHIRVYPDQIHLNGHEPELTEAELRAGTWYVEQQQNATTEDAKRVAWHALVQKFGARRSRWIVDSVQQPSPPQPKSAAWTRPVLATALPDRWVAIGYQGTAEVFRKWSSGVPDTLAVSLTPPEEDEDEQPLPENELPIDEGMRWTIDYKRALAEGMAITVTDADLTANSKLKNGLTRLIVFGVDWTFKPEDSAAVIAELLKAHRFSDGFEILKPGTPTNNTGVTRSGLNENEKKLADQYDPNIPAAGGADGTASELLMRDLGLDVILPNGNSLATEISLHHAPGAGSTEQHTASKLLNVLWRGTLGYYLDEMLNVDTDAGDDDPLISDSILRDARTHVKKYLFPGGPLPAVRLGKQPYGILPVVAPRFQPAPNDSFSGRLLSVLNKMRPFWLRGLQDVPRVTDATDLDTLDKILLRILQTTPQASTARFRRVFGSATAANTVGLKKYEEIQADVLFQIIGPHFGWSKPPRITEFVTDPRSYNLPVPWVQATGVNETERLNPNYIKEIADILRGKLGPDARAVLVAQEDADSLLQALLALAAVEEMDYSAQQLVNLHHQNIGVFETLARAPRLHIAEMLFTEKEDSVPRTSTEQTAKVYSRTELSKVILPSVTNRVPLAAYITKAAGDSQLLGQNHFVDLASFLVDLDILGGTSSAEIERAFRGMLDSYSHRLDAWYTSLATRRLEELRVVEKASGIYFGGYGWVENLMPEMQPDSLGYVHAPSIPQAITAAILRSAHLSHQTGESTPGQTPFNVDLSSQRVRTALNIINGVARGQPLAALLGYRFERSLREPDATLAKFILPFRRIAALRPNPEAIPTDKPVESIAARDVVDGVGLLERWRNEREALFQDDAFDITPPVSKLTKLLDDLADVLDAASDVLVAESVYQTVLGNYERSNAATAALDRQERPVAPDVVRTPRTGKAYAQRVMILFGSGGLPSAWSQLSDPRAKAEPRINAWVGSLLGDPKNIQIAAQVLRERTDGQPPVKGKALSATIDALGLSPLSLVFAGVPGGHKKPSELEERLAMHFASSVQDADEQTMIELLDAPPMGAKAGVIGLGELRVIVDWIRALITDRRAADARDLALAEELPEHGITDAELVELNGRVTTLTDKVKETITALHGATKAQALRKALERAAALNTPNAFPRTALDDTEAVAQLKAQTQDAVEHLQRVEQQIADAKDKLTKMINSTGKEPGKFEMAEHHASLIKIVLGKSFPVLATFKPVNPAELKASLSDQAALNNHDALAPIGWLRKMALVRPGVDALVSVLNGASLLGSSASGPASLSLVQLPHQPGQRWQALSFEDEVSPTGDVSICVHLHGKLDVTKALAGFVCDEWLELIPNAVETTALSFHYDAPGARPPHMMILAVPPDLDMQKWDFQTLSDTITETIALAQLRSIGPKEMQVLSGALLPTVYLPNNFTKDVPFTDLLKIRSKYVNVVVAPGVAGKEFLKGN